jgi:hypothetical protein
MNAKSQSRGSSQHRPTGVSRLHRIRDADRALAQEISMLRPRPVPSVESGKQHPPKKTEKKIPRATLTKAPVQSQAAEPQR